MAFITIEGENKIALQQGNSQLLNITHFVLANIDGLGAEPADRIETLPDPADIVDTRPVTKAGYVNANQVVYSLTLDSTIGDYTFNWVGLKDEDDVLIAVVYLADPITKTATDGGIEGNNLVRNFLVAFSGAQATTEINAPAETWQIDFTTRLLQIDERERLSNFDIYGHDAFFAGGFDVTLNNGTVFDVSAGVGYVGGIRCEFTNTQQIDVGSLPNAIWVDASLQGDLTGLDADVQLVASDTALTDYQDGNGIDHYVAKIADINGGAEVTNTKNQTKLDQATETELGLVELANNAEALAGTDLLRAMTPKRVREAFEQFGLGATGTTGNTKGSADFNTLTTSGFYFISGTPTNGPAGVSGEGHLIVNENFNGTAVHVEQRFLQYNSDRVFFRRITSGTPADWQEIFHDGRISDQATAETGTDNSKVITPLRMQQHFNNRLAGFDKDGKHVKFDGDLNTVLNNSEYVCNASECTNFPVGFTNWAFLKTFVHQNSDYAHQTLNSMNASEPKMFIRQRRSQVWGAWEEVATTANMPSQKTLNGYQKLMNGLIIQWMNGTAANGDVINFPITFPNECFGLTVMDGAAGNSTGTMHVLAWNSNYGLLPGSFQFLGRDTSNSTLGSSQSAYTIFAIGH
ncbi:phage tail protein [Methylophaga sp. OBS4]|uniref:phage tail-collar fiber domain-containing protein n=1 Tax=Methylophaga sp. OBS4 TaxID=2991935 RepID=UPI002256400A|nr:phage tail protein [Methylophaga sp. OBS4]MCX4187160.1 phage tail protein [Methylophaga sp. OBS4]